MAAGKHGGYRSNEFKDRESVLGFRRDDYYYRCRSGEGEFGYDREVEWRKERYDRHTIKPRCKDVKRKEELREESKDEYRGCSALSRKTADREPGELYSGSDSDGAILYDSYGMEVSKTGKYVLLPPAKKQKFSPIVWDKEAKKQQHQSFVTKICDPLNEVKEKIHTVCFSSVESNRFHGSQPSPSNTMGLFGSDTSKSSSGSSTLSYQEQQESSEREMGQLEEEGFVPTWKVPASRWADEEEGELREMTREGSEGIRAKSLESYKGHRSGSEGEDPLNELDGNEVTEVHEEDEKGSASTHYSDDSEEENYPCGTGKFPRRSVNMLQECRSVYEFERLNKINEGTYGVVFKARDKRSGEIVALKKVKMEKEREGFPLTALREINILLSSHHPSIVDVKEVVMGKNMDEIYMVMEYMEHDLKGLMETMKHPFSLSEVKCLMLQLLEGVKYLHDNWVLHRDLKTSNLLMNNQGELKICDFGLSRQYGSPSKPYTPLVVTLCYRAPELLLGAKQYSTAIDMWSLGCIMAELLAKEPLFSGKSEVDQLQKIFSTLGTPTETIWPGFSQLPGVKVNFVKHQHNLLRRKFPPTSFIGSPILSDAGFDLLSRLLTYDPEKRITAEEAVNHQWFHEVPLPKSKDFMPTFPPQHTRVR